MKDVLDPARPRDDVDRIVDALYTDPDRVEDIKDMLRSKLRAPDTVRVAMTWARVDVAEVEAEELWDNVPV